MDDKTYIGFATNSVASHLKAPILPFQPICSTPVSITPKWQTSFSLNRLFKRKSLADDWARYSGCPDVFGPSQAKQQPPTVAQNNLHFPAILPFNLGPDQVLEIALLRRVVRRRYLLFHPNVLRHKTRDRHRQRTPRFRWGHTEGHTWQRSQSRIPPGRRQASRQIPDGKRSVEHQSEPLRKLNCKVLRYVSTEY